MDNPFKTNATGDDPSKTYKTGEKAPYGNYLCLCGDAEHYVTAVNGEFLPECPECGHCEWIKF